MFEELAPTPDGNVDQSCYVGKLSSLPNQGNAEFGKREWY